MDMDFEALFDARGKMNIPTTYFDEDRMPSQLKEFVSDHLFRKWWNMYMHAELSIDQIREILGGVNGVEEGQTYETDPELFNKIGYYEWRNLISSVENDVFSPDMSTEYQVHILIFDCCMIDRLMFVLCYIVY